MPAQLDDYSKYAIPIALGSLGAVGAGTYLKHINAEKRRQRKLMAMAALLAQEEGLDKTAGFSLTNFWKNSIIKNKIHRLSPHFTTGPYANRIGPLTQKELGWQNAIHNAQAELTPQVAQYLGYRGGRADSFLGDARKMQQAAEHYTMNTMMGNKANIFTRTKGVQWTNADAKNIYNSVNTHLQNLYQTDPERFYNVMLAIKRGDWNAGSFLKAYVPQNGGNLVYLRNNDPRFGNIGNPNVKRNWKDPRGPYFTAAGASSPIPQPKQQAQRQPKQQAQRQPKQQVQRPQHDPNTWVRLYSTYKSKIDPVDLVPLLNAGYAVSELDDYVKKHKQP